MMSSETSPSFSEGSQSLAGSATKLEHRANLIPTLMRTQLTSGLQASLSLLLLLLLLLPCRTLSLSSQSAGRCVRRVTARTRSFPSTCKEPSRTRSVKVTVKVTRAPASSNNTLGIHQFVCSSVNFLPTPAPTPNHPPSFLSFLLESVTPPPPTPFFPLKSPVKPPSPSPSCCLFINLDCCVYLLVSQ